jgi:hypothetical protein
LEDSALGKVVSNIPSFNEAAALVESTESSKAKVLAKAELEISRLCS